MRRLTTKISQAFQRGAAALLIVNDVFTGANEREQLEIQRKEAEAAVVAAAEKLIDARPHGRRAGRRGAEGTRRSRHASATKCARCWGHCSLIR